jgi:hypothetical protein
MRRHTGPGPGPDSTRTPGRVVHHASDLSRGRRAAATDPGPAESVAVDSPRRTLAQAGPGDSESPGPGRPGDLPLKTVTLPDRPPGNTRPGNSSSSWRFSEAQAVSCYWHASTYVASFQQVMMWTASESSARMPQRRARARARAAAWASESASASLSAASLRPGPAARQRPRRRLIR